MRCISLSVLFLRLSVSSHVVVVHSLSLCVIVPSVNITQFILNRNISFSSYLLLWTVLPCTIWYIWINESFLRVRALEARLLDVGICVFSPQLDNANCFPKCSSVYAPFISVYRSSRWCISLAVLGIFRLLVFAKVVIENMSLWS